MNDWTRRVGIVAIFTGITAMTLCVALKPVKKVEPIDIVVKPLVLGESSINLVPNVTEKVMVSDVKNLEDFTKIVKTFPDGAFKSNLLFVLAADYNGDSIKLNEILQAYGMLLKAQAKRKNIN